MGSLKKVPAEGGSGGKRGHSGMEHWASTAEIKNAARVRRRIADHGEVEEQLADRAEDDGEQSVRLAGPAEADAGKSG